MPIAAGSLLATLLNSGFTQYPNKQTYNAATLLQPSERPTVPVRVVDPNELDGSEAAKHGDVQGFTMPAKDTIYVSNNKDTLKDPKWLAGILGHEQYHISHGMQEGPAYQLEYEILKRLDNRGKYRNQLDSLNQTALSLKDAEARQGIK